MRSLDFKYLRAKNFVCFGPDGIEIELNKYGNIILIRGNNLDVHDTEERVASNGIGKSTIADILVYALFGKTIKQPKKIKHHDVINNKSKKLLEVEVRWGNYRVIRTRKPDAIRFWESPDGIWTELTEKTLGGQPATQALIDKALGMNYDAFINVVVFTDNNAGSFLECTQDAKRDIVDNLLSLYKFRGYFTTAKDYKNKSRAEIKTTNSIYEQLLNELDSRKNRLAQIEAQEKEWKRNKQRELLELVERMKAKKQLLASSDQGAALAEYAKVQAKISALQAAIPGYEQVEAKLNSVLLGVRGKLDSRREAKSTLDIAVQEHRSTIAAAHSKLNGYNKTLTDIASKKGTKCPTCRGVILEENFQDVIIEANTQIEQLNQTIKMEGTQLTELTTEVNAIHGDITRLEDVLQQGKVKANEAANKLLSVRLEITQLSKIPVPEKGADERLLEQQIAELKEQAIARKRELEGPSPYAQIVKTAQEDVETKRAECKTKKEVLAELEDDMLYYDWLADSFDKEIRSFAISSILPDLNERVAYWLQILMDGKIKLEFDAQLDETIARNPADGDPFVYHAMSGGERRRINLAVSQAFAYIMMLSSNNSPSLVFLDEVTTNIDPYGVDAIYRMIQELAQHKQVFITTHDQGLLDMLSGVDKIELVKKDGFTKLVK